MELNVKLFCTEIELWMKLGYQTNLLKRMIKVLSLPDSFRQSRWRSLGTGVTSTAKCIICRAVATTVIKFRRTGVSEDNIMSAIEHLCTQLNIASKSVCEGVVRLNMVSLQKSFLYFFFNFSKKQFFISYIKMDNFKY